MSGTLLMRIFLAMVCGALALGPAGCGDEGVSVDYGYPLDDVLRVNHIQAKGTHNSYHVAPTAPVDESHRYTMPTLAEQLGRYGIRQLELDLHRIAGEGYTVFHLRVLDERTTCRAFADCLAEIKGWSDANPGHHLLFVWIEIKGLLDAERIEDWKAFDAAIRSVWPPERLLTPDDLRGGHPSIPTALRESGWPTLGETRDKAMFMLNNTDRVRHEYSRGGTSLAGRVMFVRGEPSSPVAALWKHGTAAEQRGALEHNLLVGDNAGTAGTGDAEAEAAVEAAWQRGVHFLASDYPRPVTDRDFVLELPGGTPSRCNPGTAPADCTSDAIEDLDRVRREISE